MEINFFKSLQRLRTKRFIEEYGKVVKEFEDAKKRLSISDERRKYFKVLGISPGSSQREIKEAYRSMMKRYHPDVNKSKDALIIAEKVNEAYQMLTKQSANFDKSEFAMLSMLIDLYNAELQKEIRKLKELSYQPVERWFYEQELNSFLDYRKRVRSVLIKAFKRYNRAKRKLLKLKRIGMKLSSKDQKLVEAIEGVGYMLSECSLIDSQIERAKRNFIEIVKKSNEEMRSKIFG
ncbi:MAG: DnaJ domain-containing protein [Candidatus Micrarchaeia archaeon]